MKRRVAELAAKFDALQRREKQLVAVMVLFAIGMGGFSFWVEPAQLRANALKKEMARQKAEMKGFETQLVMLKAQLRDPNAPLRAALVDVRDQIAAADRVLREYDKNLVPPERMPDLLQALFARHQGIELVSLQTLPPTPLLAPKLAKGDGGAETKPAEPATPASRIAQAAQSAAPALPAPDTAAPALAKGTGIVKHGIEIKMAGSYPDLLNYVQELESLPQKLLWGRMALASAYPRSEMTLTLYTLSLDPVWMVM